MSSSRSYAERRYRKAIHARHGSMTTTAPAPAPAAHASQAVLLLVLRNAAPADLWMFRDFASCLSPRIDLSNISSALCSTEGSEEVTFIFKGSQKKKSHTTDLVNGQDLRLRNPTTLMYCWSSPERLKSIRFSGNIYSGGRECARSAARGGNASREEPTSL
ncbi:hypothetical protein EVAR_85825_1 [Eumeta japonica]|uniref:Uncharacterized protein n=1 Tax=Eumeta variegata TaxID=151549 RepID=A0A4C1URM5_EUMVA|nr:hypothetical protein EVAR_85825_1 [Eumeta japonica]